ncbi:MAG: anti-sigma F factor antagonist [Syntrophomonadales bacterium]
MHVDLESIRDTLMARIKGEIDLATADELREIIDERLKKDSYKAIILDLGGVSFIDSSGLGFILGRYKKITGQGGKMYIVRARPSVSRVLELSGIKKLITVYDTENEVFKN